MDLPHLERHYDGKPFAGRQAQGCVQSAGALGEEADNEPVSKLVTSSLQGNSGEESKIIRQISQRSVFFQEQL
jgi:hypothetical protein